MKKAMKQSKLIFILNMISAFFLILALLLLSFTIMTNKKANAANEERFLLTEYATRFMNASTYISGEARGYAATGEQEHYDNYMRELNETKTREVCLEQMKKIGLNEEEVQIIDYMMSISDSLVPQEKEAMEKAAEGNYLEAAKAVLSSPYNNKITDLNNNKMKFLNVLTKNTSEKVNQLVFATRVMEVITFLVGIAVIILQFVSYRIIKKKVIIPIIAVEQEARRMALGELSNTFEMEPDTSEIGMLIDSMQSTKKELHKYVKDISEKLSRMAKHDLSVIADIKYIGDFTPIQTSLEKIIRELNVSFRQFDFSADQVAETAGQISSGAIFLSESAMYQASSVEQISAAISEISEKMKSFSEKSQLTSGLAVTAGVELNKSKKEIQGILAVMTEIDDTSDEIEKSIKAMEDIAVQTKALVARAEEEARKAGEAGQGFSPVVKEAHNLVEKSEEVRNITSKMMETSLKIIQDGTRMAKEASNTYTKLMVDAQETVKSMVAIDEDAQKQVVSIVQINTGIEQIVEIVQVNSANAEKSAIASEELENQAEELRSLVHQYIMNDKAYS